MGGLAIRYFKINFFQRTYYGLIGYKNFQNSSVLSPMTTARKGNPLLRTRWNAEMPLPKGKAVKCAIL